MKWINTLIIMLFMAACGPQPAPMLMGGKRIDLQEGGRDYTVYYTENAVEIIRLGWASRAEHAAIRQTMISLIPKATGCKLSDSGLTGDSGEMRGRINCPRDP